MTGLVRRIALGQVFPGSARAQNPEYAVEHIARIAPRTTSAIVAYLRLRQQWLNDLPLRCR